MNVVTNNHKYEILSFCDLDEKYQRKARIEFDWIDDIEESSGYFIYKKELYNLGSFIRHNDFLTDEKSGKKFYAHGIYSWSAFNGLAIEFVDRDEAVKIAYCYS
jgi:hypothetical protein